MVIDKLENAWRYRLLHPLFQKSFDFLNETGGNDPGSDSVAIHQEFCFALFSDKEGKKRADARLEAHREYIDIQFLVEGTEEIGWRTAGSCKKISSEYNEEKDVLFYADQPETWVTLTPGTFAIFFPEDAHAPMVSSGRVKKCVVKVQI